ncbi:MAG: ABC transporter ATP-binding protein [Clostridiales bacterium]|nr:ABC transporter ATP-binding protein [Clostridiales bacterium]
MTKVYSIGEVQVQAAAGISLAIAKGEFAVIVGPSGAGKSTVLNILGGMDTLSSGRLIVDDCVVSDYDRVELTAYRRNNVGFVFQFYNLVPNLTALENVELALQICNDPLDPEETLRAVGLGDRIHNFPAQLSGGEQQRVSIARAIAKNPKLLLCDEPTGALDCATGKTVLALLREACHKHKKTVIVVTHNQAIAQIADHVIQVRDGLVSGEIFNENPARVDEIEW